MIKEMGGFVQNTIQPMIDQMNDILNRLEGVDVKLNKYSIKAIIYSAATFHIFSIILEAIIKITVTVIICNTALKILA